MIEDPALALIEFSSIAIGLRASDALAKKAPVKILRAGTFQPGRYAVVFTGMVAAVEDALLEAGRIGAAVLADRILLHDVHPSVREAVGERIQHWDRDTIGVIETSTLAAVLEAADAAVKSATVEIVQIRLGDGLGGKGLVIFSGLQADVESAVETGVARIAHRGTPCWTSVIPRFDADVRAALESSTRLGDGW